MANQIVQLTRAVQLLAEARTFDDMRHVHSIAQAAEEYARAEKLGDEAERHAREIRVRAARKAGEMLQAMKDTGERDAGRGGDRRSPSSGTSVKLGSLGITFDESSRWQRLAKVSDEEFEKAVAEGWGETAIARGQSRPRATGPTHLHPERGKRDGPTLKQSLDSLQGAAIRIEALAETLDSHFLAEWPRLYDLAEAQQWFDLIETSLPLLHARLKRLLRERKADVRDTAAE